jgi:hypothetical protein
MTQRITRSEALASVLPGVVRGVKTKNYNAIVPHGYFRCRGCGGWDWSRKGSCQDCGGKRASTRFAEVPTPSTNTNLPPPSTSKNE